MRLPFNDRSRPWTRRSSTVSPSPPWSWEIIEKAKEHFTRVLEIGAPEDLRGLESHVLRALPERVAFLRWSLQGHHVNMPLAFSVLPASSPRPSAFVRSLLAVDAEPPVGKLGHLLQVGSSACAYCRMVAPIEVCFFCGLCHVPHDQVLWWSPPGWSRAGGGENEKFDTYLLVSDIGSILKRIAL